jgi:hypothetical protein
MYGGRQMVRATRGPDDQGAGPAPALDRGAISPQGKDPDVDTHEAGEQSAQASAVQVLLGRLGQLTVGEGIAHDRMTVFPVRPIATGDGRGGQVVPLRYHTLEQAIGEGWVTVTERPSATVPELIFQNVGETMVLVLDGEEIIGGLQNRIVNATFLVAPRTTTPLPVTCVEHGRWHEVSPTFASGESSYFSLRREKHAQVHASLRSSGRHTSDQGLVWSSVAARQAITGSDTPTGAMHDIYRSRQDSLEAYERAFPYIAGAIGLIVALNGQVVGADLLDQLRSAEVLWPKLVRSYALDGLVGAGGGPVTRESAVELLERARTAHGEVYPSIALGEDVRLEGEGVVGGALVYEGTPVHVTLFRPTGEEHASPGRMARASIRRALTLRQARTEQQQE